MSILGDVGLYCIRHAGNLCKTHVLWLAAFGGLYALGLNPLKSLAIATCCAVVSILLFTFLGDRALKVTAFIGACGFAIADRVYLFGPDDGAYLPGIASAFGAIGFLSATIPARQISVWELVGLSKPPESEQ